MVLNNTGVETGKSSASSTVSTKKPLASTSTSKCKNDVDPSKRAKKSPARKGQRGRSKTSECVNRKTTKAPPLKRAVSAGCTPDSREMDDKQKPAGWINSKPELDEREEKKQPEPSKCNTLQGGQKKNLIYEKPSETYSKLLKGGFAGRSVKSKLNSDRPSEIPKLKQLAKMKAKKELPESTKTKAPSKTPQNSAVKETFYASTSTRRKEIEEKMKKELKDEKVRAAMKESFHALVPLYETDLKIITDTWVNSIYCSLMMRTNLIKLLYQAMPNISTAQFHMEDETILKCIARAKNHTRSESENLIQLIKLLIANRNKAKEEYIVMVENKTIADSYNNNWRSLTKRIVEIGEETKQLQIEIPELLRRKETYETSMNEKIEQMKAGLSQKDEEIKKLSNQLSLLKQREHSYKGNVPVKVEDYKDIKEEVVMLKAIEKEFEELKTKYTNQNEMYEKQIKELQNLLDEKMKILKTEKDLKKQLRTLLLQLHSHQQHLYRTMGKEQVDFVMGRPFETSNKRREQLWVASIRLVLKGFMVQMRKLERDRNKMLLELHSNDYENYNTLATTIMQKENFIKSIRRQMQTLHLASKYSTVKTSASSFAEIVRS